MAKKINSKTKFAVHMLLAASMVVTRAAAADSLSTSRLHSEINKQNLQVQVYDALESLHNDEWAGKTMSTQELLQLDSEEQLNSLLVDHLAKHNKKSHKHQEHKQNAVHLDCIIGGEKCMYKDKDALINGEVTSYVQTGFEQGETYILPGISEFVMNDQSIEIDEDAFDKNGKLIIDKLLEKKLQDDIKKQTNTTNTAAQKKAEPQPASKNITKPQTATAYDVSKQLSDLLTTTSQIKAQEPVPANKSSQAQTSAKPEATPAPQPPKSEDMMTESTLEEKIKAEAEAQARAEMESQSTTEVQAEAEAMQASQAASQAQSEVVAQIEAEKEVVNVMTKTSDTIDEAQKALDASAKRISEKTQELAQLNEKAEKKLQEDAKMVAEQNEKSEKERLEKETKAAIEKAKKEMEQKKKHEEEEQKKKEIIAKQKKTLAEKFEKDARAKLEAKQKQKEMLTEKLRLAEEKKTKEILAQQAKEQAAQLARQHAQLLAEAKAEEIARQMMLQQEQEEQRVQEAERQKQALIKAQQDEQQRQQAAIAMQQKRQEQARLALLEAEKNKKMQEESLKQQGEELLRQEQAEKEEKQRKLDEEEALQGDLGEMMGQYKKSINPVDAEQASQDKSNVQLESSEDVDLFNPKDKVLISQEKAHLHRKAAEVTAKVHDVKTNVTAPKTAIAAVLKKDVQCPACKECAATSCPKQIVQQPAKTFNVDLDEDKVSFKLMADNIRDQLTSVEVIDHDRIMGYSTYNDILTQTRSFDMDDRESDFYNVTVNFVVKRLPKYEADLLQKQAAIEINNTDPDFNSGYLFASQKLHEKDHFQGDDSELMLIGDEIQKGSFKKQDKVAEAFKNIQNQDMEQEKYTDQKVKKVIQNQQKALEDKEPFFGLSEAEKEANKLSESLTKHQMTVQQLEREDDMKKFRNELTSKSSDDSDHDKTLHALKGDMANIQIDLKEGTKLNQETVAKTTALLESQVQKLLDQLTILTNNQYSDGKHVYDYQLVRLTESQAKAEQEALAKADEVFFKHSTLKRQEEEMNEKFLQTKAQLEEYKEKFYKDKKSLESDHDSYVKIKEKTESEIKEQLDIQKQRELTVNEALQQKADLRIKDIKAEEAKEKEQLKLVELKQKQLKEKQEAEEKAKKVAEAKRQQELAEKKKQDAIKAAEAEAQAKILAKKKEVEAKQAKLESDIRHKVELEIQQKHEIEQRKLQQELAQKQREAEEQAAVQRQKREHEIELVKQKNAERLHELELIELRSKQEIEEQEKAEEKAAEEAKELENQEQLAQQKAADQLQKKKEAAHMAQRALKAKEKSIAEAKEAQEKLALKEKEIEQAKQQALAQLEKQKAEQQVKQEALAKKTAEAIEFQKKMVADAAAEAQKKKDEADKAQKAQLLVQEQQKAELELALAEQQQAEEAQKLAEAEAKKEMDDAAVAAAAAKNKTTQALAEQKNQTTESKPISNDNHLQIESAMTTLEPSKVPVNSSDAKAIAEREAIEKVTLATLQGIKKGEAASKKLHEDAKVQTEEQTAEAIEKLKTKFDNTKSQVINIVQNFGQIHSDLQELKQEYLQEQGQLNNFLQLGSKMSTQELSQNEARVEELQSRIQLKKSEVNEVVQNFRNMHSDLSSIKSQFDREKHGREEQLTMLRNQDEDTQLSLLFEQQSLKLRGQIENKLRSAIKK